MNNAIDAVIFDFGGVLIDVDYTKTIRAFEELGISNFESLYSKAQQSDLFNLFETGTISAQRFINELLTYLPPGTSPNQVVQAWNAMIGEVPASGIALLEELRATNKHVFLLSNTNELHIPVAYRKWSAVSDKTPEELFNKVYLSHQLGMRKPNPEIFRKVCALHQLTPERTLFIDDSIQHIEGARKIGLQTHHLLSMEELPSVFS